MGYEGGGGATFLTSDGFQIFFGALYHEMVLSSPEHKGSGNFEFLSCELLFMAFVITIDLFRKNSLSQSKQTYMKSYRII